MHRRQIITLRKLRNKDVSIEMLVKMIVNYGALNISLQKIVIHMHSHLVHYIQGSKSTQKKKNTKKQKLSNILILFFFKCLLPLLNCTNNICLGVGFTVK